MVFVTVGSQKFQFDRLLKAVDALCANGTISESCFAQTGACSYVPEHMGHKPFLDREEFRAKMDACDTVITHGGTGAIIGAVKDGKRVVAVPRHARYGEHVDDHQVEIVRQFDEMGLIEPCYEVAGLADAYRRLRERKYLAYTSNTDRFVADLGGYIDSLGGANK